MFSFCGHKTWDLCSPTRVCQVQLFATLCTGAHQAPLSNPHPLLWKANLKPLDLQESPFLSICDFIRLDHPQSCHFSLVISGHPIPTCPLKASSGTASSLPLPCPVGPLHPPSLQTAMIFPLILTAMHSFHTHLPSSPGLEAPGGRHFFF